MGSLFFKIFAWFWLAMALVAGVFVMFERASHVESERHNSIRAFFHSIIEDRAALVLDKWLESGAAGARAYVERNERVTGMIGYFFSSAGAELTGRTAPVELAAFARRVPNQGTYQEQMSAAPPMIGVRVVGSDGATYVYVAEPPPGPPHGVAGFLMEAATLWPRFLSVIALSGVVCYALALLLTRPVRRLRGAARRLAEGDLTARSGMKRSRFGDEIGSLGADFDYMAERVEALVSAQVRLLQDMSHELRSPLARLHVALELARNQASPELQGSLDRISAESVRLNMLIGQVLTVARLEARSGAPLRSRVDLAALLREVVADADFEGTARGAHVQLGRCDPCTLQAAPALLRSAIENVIRNAVHYTQAGSAAEASLACVQDGNARAARIEIRDRGPGVPEQSLCDIFRPFYRVSDARERDTGGVGLGLAIAQRAIQSHGGRISAANAPGGGLLVRIELPCD